MFQILLTNISSSKFRACRTLLCFNRNIREFPGEIGHYLDPKFSFEEVNRRICTDEFSCFSSSQKNGFSANQLSININVGVNRPVEDRWSAFRLGNVADSTRSFFPPDHPVVLAAKEFEGGHLYTVVDGHGGHTNAHAINLLHADFIKASLCPSSALELLLKHLQDLDGWHKPCELVEQCWIRARAKGSDGKMITCGPQGPWGNLDSGVAEYHGLHLKRFIVESLSLSSFDSESDLFIKKNNSGDLCDPEGFVVISASEIPLLPEIFGHGTSEMHIKRISMTVEALRNGLIRLDNDINLAALPEVHRGVSSLTSHPGLNSQSHKNASGGLLNKSLLRIVMSGCVLSSLYVPANKSELFAMQVGDCATVLGSQLPTACVGEYNPADWQARLMVSSHNAQNSKEILRIRNEHPIHEADFIFREDRLLGELMPLRAFGDIRLKWSAETLKKVASLLDLPPNYPVCPRFYQTPPYLISTPQISWAPLNIHQTDNHRLIDRFVILASDGLWDVCTPEEAVQVVAKHMADYNNEPWNASGGDTAASRLIRTALGGLEMDPRRIAIMLSVPANIARYYRDDITVIVVYLDAEPLN